MLVLVVCLLLSRAATAVAADDHGVAVGANFSAINIDSQTSWSTGGGFEYRFNHVAGLELEITAAPKLKGDLPIATIQSLQSSVFLPNTIAPTIFPGPTFSNQRGRAVIFTNNVRVHIPSTSDRLDPFFVAGGGIANLRRSADFVYPPLPLPAAVVGTVLRPTPQPITTSSTGLALTLGGGIGVRVASQLWIEGDLRVFRLMDSDDRNLGRFGAGVRYRF